MGTPLTLRCMLTELGGLLAMSVTENCASAWVIPPLRTLTAVTRTSAVDTLLVPLNTTSESMLRLTVFCQPPLGSVVVTPAVVAGGIVQPLLPLKVHRKLTV